MPFPDDLNLDEHFQDPDPNGLHDMAARHKMIFDAYMNVDFTREEALQLTVTTLTVWAMTPSGPDD